MSIPNEALQKVIISQTHDPFTTEDIRLFKSERRTYPEASLTTLPAPARNRNPRPSLATTDRNYQGAINRQTARGPYVAVDVEGGV